MKLIKTISQIFPLNNKNEIGNKKSPEGIGDTNHEH